MATKKTVRPAAPEDFPALPDAGTRAELSEREWHYLHLETSGAPVKGRRVSARFIKAQKESAHSEAKSKRVEPPRWARKVIAEQGGFPEILEEAQRRALRSPNEKTLREVYAVLREIGRDPRGTEAIRKVLTQENLDRILK